MYSRKRRSLLIIIGAIVLAAAIGFGGLWLVSCETSTGDDKSSDPSVSAVAQVQPKETGLVLPILNLEGTWVHKTDRGGVFEATVTQQSIKIVMKAPNGTTMVYWNGTFDAQQSVDAVVDSNDIGDQAVLSQSQTKNFKIGEKTISFDYTAMGVTKTVSLRRA